MRRDTNDVRDVFLRDQATGTTTRVSVGDNEQQTNFEFGNGASFGSGISANGRVVVFGTAASNLVPGDSNGKADVFVRDRATGSTTRVTLSDTEEQLNRVSGAGAISADGRYVAFDSFASNVVPGDTNNENDVFVRDRLGNSTTRASVDNRGQQAIGRSLDPSISADGRVVAFGSDASNLVRGDTNDSPDVFARSRGAE